MTLSAKLKERIARKVFSEFDTGYQQSAVSILAEVEALEVEVEMLRKSAPISRDELRQAILDAFTDCINAPFGTTEGDIFKELVAFEARKLT